MSIPPVGPQPQPGPFPPQPGFPGGNPYQSPVGSPAPSFQQKMQSQLPTFPKVMFVVDLILGGLGLACGLAGWVASFAVDDNQEIPNSTVAVMAMIFSWISLGLGLGADVAGLKRKAPVLILAALAMGVLLLGVTANVIQAFNAPPPEVKKLIEEEPRFEKLYTAMFFCMTIFRLAYAGLWFAAAVVYHRWYTQQFRPQPTSSQWPPPGGAWGGPPGMQPPGPFYPRSGS